MAHTGFDIIGRARFKLLEKYKYQDINIYKIEYVATFEDWDDGIGVWIFFKTNDELQKAKDKNLLAVVKEDFLDILRKEDYPFNDFPKVVFVFDSDENVQRNYEGSYFYRLR